MTEYETQFMSSCALQLKLLYPQTPQNNEDIPRIYRRILTTIDAVSIIQYS